MSILTILILTAILEVSIVVAFFTLVNEIKSLEQELDMFRKLYSDSFEKLVDAYDGLRKIDDARQEVYKKIIDSDDNMQKIFEQGHEIDKKILETWKGVQETYSFAYEEYRQCIEKLESLDKANVDIYAKLLTIEKNTKPIDLSVEQLSIDDMDWEPNPFYDDDSVFEEVEDE